MASRTTGNIKDLVKEVDTFSSNKEHTPVAILYENGRVALSFRQGAVRRYFYMTPSQAKEMRDALVAACDRLPKLGDDNE